MKRIKPDYGDYKPKAVKIPKVIRSSAIPKPLSGEPFDLPHGWSERIIRAERGEQG